jgi:NADH-quinone oxidoreductase subunit L
MYSISYMHDENMHKYFAYLNLFIFFMITLVIGSNLLVSSVGKCWSLFVSSYRFWHKIKTLMMQLKAFMMKEI